MSRVRHWLIEHQPEGTNRRRPGDAMRVVLAVTALALLALHAHHPTGAERAVVRFFASLPDGVTTAFRFGYDVVALWAIALLVITVLLVRRWRLTSDVLVAAAGAWLVGWALAIVVTTSDPWKALQLTVDVTEPPRFPFVPLGVAVAAIAVAAPHLTRPTRLIGRGLVLVLALAAMDLGRASPNDLVAAVVLGWGAAAAVHYAFGTPVGRPTVAQVEDALRALGVAARRLRLAPDQPVGRAVFLADGADGPVQVSALGRDEADAQFLARARRYIAFRDAPPILVPTRHQQVESEAYAALLAREGGADVARVVYGGSAGSLAVLVERVPPGRLLADVAPTAVDDGLLDALWSEVATMHEARVAHGKLDAHHVVVDGAAPVIVGFESASIGRHPHRLAGDVAQLLAATAKIVGPDRAVAAAQRGVGDDAVTAALPLLQRVALSGWTHDAYGDSLDEELERLRAVGARVTHTEAPELRKVYRVHPRQAVMAGAAMVAVGTLISRVGDPVRFWHVIEHADWLLVSLAFVLTLVADAVYGITFLGNVPVRIPIWPSIELQIAMGFSHLAVPIAADAAIQVRFLQKNGLDLSSATATGGVLSSVTEIGVQITLFIVALRLSPDTIHFGRINTGKVVVVVLIGAFAIGVAAAVLFGVRRLRHAVVPPIVRAARTVWSAVRSPGRLALLIGGNVVAQFVSVAGLLACIHAFGASIDLWTLMAINIGIGTLASFVPIPGGGTAVSAIGLAGMITAFGVPHAAAGAAVLTYHAVHTYLPAVPGWFATNDLIRKGML